MNSLLYLIVVIASNFVDGQTNSSTTTYVTPYTTKISVYTVTPNRTLQLSSTLQKYDTQSSNGTVSSTSLHSPSSKTNSTKTTLALEFKSSAVAANETVKTKVFSSTNVGETTTPFETGSVSESSNTVGINTDSMIIITKSNYLHSLAGVSSTASTKIQSSAMANSSDGVISPTNMIKPTSPVTTRSPGESSAFVQASLMTSNISLSMERAPTITATPPVIPSTTNPTFSVAQSTTNTVVTPGVPATTQVTLVRPTATQIIHATTSVIANSTSSSGTQYVVPSTPMLVTSDTTTTLVSSTTAPMLNATAASTVVMKATQSAVQSMTTPPDATNSSTSGMMVSSSSPTSAPTTTTTMPRNATIPMSTIQSPTSATNASVFSSAVMPTESLNTRFETHVTTTPVVNMTSSMKGLSSSPAISSTTHPSSSQVITPGPPEIVLVRITVNANCSQVLTNQSTVFKVAVQRSVSEVLNISSSKINISAVTCGSIIVDMAIENVNNENITKKLTDAVNNKQLNISYNGTQLPVTLVNKLTTKPITPTVTTSSVSRASSTSNPMSSYTVVTEKLSTLPVTSAIDTASAMSTRATNASIFLSATMSSSAAMQTVPPIGKMNTSFVTHVTTSAVENMTTRATNTSIFAKTTVLSSHSSGLVQTTPAIGKMNTSFVTRVTTSLVANLTSLTKTIIVQSTETLATSPQSESISQVLANSSTLLFRSASDTTSAMNTNATNSSIFAKATMLTPHSSAIMQTMSPTEKMTPAVNMTSTATTTIVTESFSRSSQSESISQVLANSSTPSVTAVSATASRAVMSKQATNSSTFAKATVLSSHSFVVIQTMSPTGKTSFVTHVRTSPAVNMTSSIRGLSSSPAISSTTHPSSSQIITPIPPIVLVRITIDADCNRVQSQSSTFKDAVRLSCSKVLNISLSKITITAVKCGSILVDMEIQNVNNENITQKLEDAVSNNQLNISYNGTQLAVTSVKELTTKPTSKNDDDDDDDNTAFIIYIVFGSALGLAFLIVVVVLIVRCRRERSTGMFHLPSEENLELSGFSAQNTSYQGGNFYGDMQPAASEHRISGIADEPDPVPNGNTEDGGDFGGAYLPAWKNLPTMDVSEVHRNDDTNDNLLLTYGKTAGEEGNDSGLTDVVPSYDNVGAV